MRTAAFYISLLYFEKRVHSNTLWLFAVRNNVCEIMSVDVRETVDRDV